MTRPSRKDMARLTDRLGPEDGIDPRLARPDLTGRTIRRNTLRLCGQVARTLGEAFAGCGDEILRDLCVLGVVPAAGAGRLLVSVALSPSAPPRGEREVEARLDHALGMLRGEVSAAVHRRKAPELVFQLAGSAPGV